MQNRSWSAEEGGSDVAWPSIFNTTFWTYENESNYDEYDNLYDVPAGLIALLSICYGSISVLAVVGNALVMWIVATSRRMQSVTNCFIANLALADIVIGLFAIPFQFQAALLQRWNLPYFMCAFCPFVQVLSVNVSVFTLTAIAVDRHRAILKPLSARPSKLRAKIIIAGIWLLGGALAAPMAAALRVIIIPESPGAGRFHHKPFCQNVNLSEKSMLIYRALLGILQYLTPLSVISCVYARMALRLWGSRAPGNAQDSRDANLMKNKKKVIKMLVIVVALFAVCWLPLQTYNVLQYTYSEINEYRYINIIWFCCDWLAMSNSCYNPFIYGIYNEKFKREFQQRCPFRSRKWSASPPTDSLDLDKTQSTRASIRYTDTYCTIGDAQRLEDAQQQRRFTEVFRYGAPLVYPQTESTRQPEVLQHPAVVSETETASSETSLSPQTPLPSSTSSHPEGTSTPATLTPRNSACKPLITGVFIKPPTHMSHKSILGTPVVNKDIISMVHRLITEEKFHDINQNVEKFLFK